MINVQHVKVTGLTHVFQGNGHSLTALQGVNFSMDWGEFVSIIGPTGCGKSTLLRIVGGLLSPTEGTVALANHDPARAQREKEIGFVFQDPALLPWRSVRKNVELPLEVNRGKNGDKRRTAAELLELVGLAEFANYYPHQLSGGMQQRVALARALAFGPSLLLMDEPFGALDEITRESMRYELLRIWSRPDASGQGHKKTALFVTHSIPEAITLSDRVLVLSHQPGRVKAIIDIDLPRPRDEGGERTEAFLDYVAQLKGLLKEAA